MTNFSDSFLEALGLWQNGWSEDQTRRPALASSLLSEAQAIPVEFRTVNSACYRKRFLLSSEVIPLFFRSLHDGITSWSTDRTLAEEFKYRMRPGTVTGMVFRYEPKLSEVVLNIPALWECPEFVAAAESYRDRGMPMAGALFHFRGNRNQHEIVLSAPLNPEDIVTLSGETNTSFAEFCKTTNLPVLLEDAAWKALLASDLQPQAPSFVRDEAAQAVVLRAVEQLTQLLERAHRS
jgi:hypothetical protein